MNKPKPIAVVYYLPELLSRPGGNMVSVYEVNEIFRDMLPDYYTLAVPSHLSADGSCEDIRLEVFYEKDFTPIQYEELKKLVLDSLPKPSQPTEGK